MRRDVRPIASKYRAGGWGGGRSYTYDDEGRGKSKDIWEWFQEYFALDPTLRHLLDIPQNQCYQLLKYSTMRHGLMDIAYMFSPGWGSVRGDDTRAHRLVLKHLSEPDWVRFHSHLVAGYNAEKDRVEKEQHEHAEKQRGEFAAYDAQREAERIRVEEEDYQKVFEVVNMTAGMLVSDIHQVVTSAEQPADYGDAIDDVVDAYQGQGGWLLDVNKAKGVKLQITLSLDMSNSMKYNGLDRVAAATFRDLGMTLKALQATYPDDMYTAYFQFSDDSYRGRGTRGRGTRVVRLEVPELDKDNRFGEFREFRPSIIENRGVSYDGTDTWFFPLFREVEIWEKKYSDPGAVRLDLIITDAVVEHAKDIRESNIIQERRDGALYTIMLNFAPEEEWVNSTLPKRCFQMKVDKDNIAGILRKVLAEFVSMYM